MDVNPAEIAALVSDLDKAAHRAIPDLTQAVKQSTQSLARAWQSNARITAGRHGRHYPSSITSETSFGFGTIRGEVGPDTGKAQGGMGRGFEYGSRNQRPHLDGSQAADKEEPKFAKGIEQAAAKVLEDL